MDLSFNYEVECEDGTKSFIPLLIAQEKLLRPSNICWSSRFLQGIRGEDLVGGYYKDYGNGGKIIWADSKNDEGAEVRTEIGRIFSHKVYQKGFTNHLRDCLDSA